MKIPIVFVSYAWESDSHRKWVRDLAARLRGHGVDAILDRWAAIPGDRLPAFMEQAVSSSDYVVIICTPAYQEKSDHRKGGVGYEGDIMTGELFTGTSARKFIPVLRSGEPAESLPAWLKGDYFIDLRGDPHSEDEYRKLLDTLHNRLEKAPPIVDLDPFIDAIISSQAINQESILYGKSWLENPPNAQYPQWVTLWKKLYAGCPSDADLIRIGNNWLGKHLDHILWPDVFSFALEVTTDKDALVELVNVGKTWLDLFTSSPQWLSVCAHLEKKIPNDKELMAQKRNRMERLMRSS